MSGVTAAEKAAILSHYRAQAALASDSCLYGPALGHPMDPRTPDPDDLTLDLQCAIENMVEEAGRAERAMQRGDLSAALDILRAAVVSIAKDLE